MECRAGSQRNTITNNREDKHPIRMVLMDPPATSRVLSQEMKSFARQLVFARTVR